MGRMSRCRCSLAKSTVKPLVVASLLSKWTVEIPRGPSALSGPEPPPPPAASLPEVSGHSSLPPRATLAAGQAVGSLTAASTRWGTSPTFSSPRSTMPPLNRYCSWQRCYWRGTGVEEKQIPDENELVSDGGFVAPVTNSFGQTFRAYDAESGRRNGVEELYRTNHINQTYDFVKRMREEYGQLNRVEMSIWECCERLNEVVDESDPDLDEPQIEHLLQTAEAIRRDYPNEDWLHLTGLIHDLGKVLLLPGWGQLPQWAVVGDTFPVGCAFSEAVVHHKHFKENPDYTNPAYNTKFGVYSEGCGLDKVMMSWGHDDYMYMVAKENKTTLPSAALFIIRFHSFYPLHREGAYKHLMNEEDKENLKWLQIFSTYDLYSKSKVRIDVEKVKPYYLPLIEKYFPAKLKW